MMNFKLDFIHTSIDHFPTVSRHISVTLMQNGK